MPETKRHFYYTRRRVRRQARKDGRSWRWRLWPPIFPFREDKSPQPPPDQKEPALYELEILKAAEQDIAIDARTWRELDIGLKEKFCLALDELDRAKESFEKETREAEEAAKELRDAQEQVLKMEPPVFSRRFVFITLALIGACEFSLNAVVFQILGAGLIATYLAAGIIGLALILGAHWFGSRLHQTEKTMTDKALIEMGPLVFLALLGVVGFLRGKFFSAEAKLGLLGIKLTPHEAMALFFVINVALFFVASVISYEGAHPQKSLYGMRQNRLRVATKLFHRESAEARVSVNRLERARQGFHHSRVLRQKTFDRLVENASATKEQADWFVSLYRASNLQVRSDGVVPPCFEKPAGKVKIAATFTKGEIEWECHGLEPIEEEG